MNTFKFGEIVIDGELKMPQLEIIMTSEEGDSKSFYLSPFRGYKFQVSGTPTGDGDYGSSQVIGLKHVSDMEIPNGYGYGYQTNNNDDGIRRVLLTGLAYSAIVGLCQYPHNRKGENYTNMYFDSSILNTFIYQVYEWLKTVKL